MIEIVALSDAMREALGLAERVAPTDANVLVTGESGTGKDALAAFIHSRSTRARQPLVKIGCAAEYQVARETLARMIKEQAAKK